MDKQQIKEVLDEIICYCENRRCSECPLEDDWVDGHCLLGKPNYYWDAEDIAEVVADERS